jgi:hypothetical protein
MKKTHVAKLKLDRNTIRPLAPANLERVQGGGQFTTSWLCVTIETFGCAPRPGGHG